MVSVQKRTTFNAMKLINRGFLMVKPKQPFIEWALSINPELMIDEDSEGSLYLIEEDFWDDNLILEKYAKKIWKQECHSVLEGNLEIELPIYSGNLNEFFNIELGCTVIDLLKDPISKEDL